MLKRLQFTRTPQERVITGFSPIHFQQGLDILPGSSIIFFRCFIQAFTPYTCYPSSATLLPAGKDCTVSHHFFLPYQPSPTLLSHLWSLFLYFTHLSVKRFPLTKKRTFILAIKCFCNNLKKIIFFFHIALWLTKSIDFNTIVAILKLLTKFSANRNQVSQLNYVLNDYAFYI